MSLTGLILGLINIAIVVAVFVLIGAVAVWILTPLGWPPPEPVRKFYILLVALIALYMVVALIFGIPTINIFR